MNYEIQFVDANGDTTTFKLYNAGSIREALDRFEKANPGCFVVAISESTSHPQE